MKLFGQLPTAMILLISAIGSLICGIPISNPAHALVQKFYAYLKGTEEIPPNNSTATGQLWLEASDSHVEYRLNVTGLDNVMAAHIHLGESGKNGDPIVTLFHSGPTGQIDGTLIRGSITSSDFQGPMSSKSIDEFMKKVMRSQTYVNIHTGLFPDGEIRGEISAESATLTN